jgi:NAD(P)-dependent dehydrogenase (short-subunit alcohol dehydrogenase family)
MELDGQVIIVTGSSRGIGEAIALLLAREGATVVVVARGAAACEAVVGRITAEGGRALSVPTDVVQERHVERLVAGVLAQFGQVDGLVNTAGVGQLASLPDTTLEIWQRHLDANLTGTFLCCRAVWAPMAEQGWGSILNVTSSAVNDPHAGWSAYLASKAGAVALTGCLAKEGYPLGIRVNGLMPGATATVMRAANFPTEDTSELLTPEEVAAVTPMFFTSTAKNLFGVQLEVRKRPRGMEPRLGEYSSFVTIRARQG